MSKLSKQEISKLVKEFSERHGIEETDIDEETVKFMTDHELLSCKFAEWNPYEEEIIIAEMIGVVSANKNHKKRELLYYLT